MRDYLCKTELFILTALFFFTVKLFAQDESETLTGIKAIADGVINGTSFQLSDSDGKKYSSYQEAPSGTPLHLESYYNDWRYWNGVLNIALLELSDVLDNQQYTEFVHKNISFSFDNYEYFESNYNDEGKWSYPLGQFFIMEELDDCGAVGAGVIEVYKTDPQKRYRDYIDRAAYHILNKQDRLKDGTFVRSFPHKWTLWADDLYMSLSFLSRMGELTNDNRYFDDAAQQVINFHKYLFDEEKGLMYHCWYSDIEKNGVAFWGRANGWALLAQVDLLDRIPKNHPKRSELLSLLRRHILGISRYQSGSGLWHQLLDKEDSYLETSCSAMITYALARAVNRGYIEPRYASIAKAGWEGIKTKIRSDGKVEGVSTGTVVSDDLVYYYHRPAPLNDIHGIGTVLLAGSEILRLN